MSATGAGDVVGGGQVVIELTSGQVEEVVRGAAGAGALVAVLSGLVSASRLDPVELRELNLRGLSRSLLMGLLILAVFPQDGQEKGIAELARLLGLNTSTTHRYISTLVAVGLLERDPATRRYRLAR